MPPLRYFRLLNNMTQEALAKAVGVSQATIAGYEKGRSPIPTELLPKLSAVLGVKADLLTSLKEPTRA